MPNLNALSRMHRHFIQPCFEICRAGCTDCAGTPKLLPEQGAVSVQAPPSSCCRRARPPPNSGSRSGQLPGEVCHPRLRPRLRSCAPSSGPTPSPPSATSWRRRANQRLTLHQRPACTAWRPSRQYQAPRLRPAPALRRQQRRRPRPLSRRRARTLW